jgi:hypothetical protein
MMRIGAGAVAAPCSSQDLQALLAPGDFDEILGWLYVEYFAAFVTDHFRTIHDLICAILNAILAQLAPSASGYLPMPTKFDTIYG